MPLPSLYLSVALLSPALIASTPSFEANLGQADPEVQYLARSPDCTLFLTREGAVLVRNETPVARPLRLSLVGARDSRPGGEAPTEQRSNYFLGDDPARWVVDVPHFNRVAYREVFPGIDLVFHAQAGQLEYDIVAAPGADLDCVALRLEGAEKMEIDGNGDLLLHVEDGVLRQRKPVVYQPSPLGREPIDGSYVIDADGLVRFRIARHEPDLALVIDPILIFSSFLGGTEGDLVQGIAVDRFGSAHVTGFTAGADFPTLNPFQGPPKTRGQVTAFVTKLSSTGREILWSTYLGGVGTSWGKSIAILPTGNAVISGWTEATNFPKKSPLQAKHGGGFDLFLTSLTAAGNALVVSTTWGGAGDEQAQGMAFDKNALYLAGSTTSTDFPLVTPLDDTLGGPSDAFVMKLKDSLGAVLYSTYLGGKGSETARGIAAFDGEAFVTGETRSIDFPVKSPLQNALKGNSDAFVTRLKVDGLALGYSTYLGGAGGDDGWAIAVDSDRQAYVTGRASGGFPLESSLFDPLGNTLLFVTKLQAGGSASVFSTLLASNVTGIPEAIAINRSNDVFVGGSIAYLGDGFSSVPSRGPALQPIYGGGASDGFLYRLDTTGTFFDYASFIGGSQGEEVTCLALGEKEQVYLGGLTGSANFPHTLGARDTSHNGQNDGFIARVDTLNYPDDPPYVVLGAAANLQLTGAAPFKRYRAVIPPGLRAIVTVTDADPLDWNAVYARYNGEARPHTFDFAAEDRGKSTQRLVIPETQVGELYLYLQATHINGPSNAVTIKVDAVEFAIEDVAPRRIAAGSRMHTSVRGAGFRSDAVFTVARMSGGPTIPAQEIRVLSSSHAEAVFDLAGQATGMYRLKGFNPDDGSDGFESAFEVVAAGTPGILDVRLSGRDTARFNRATSIRVIYENSGDQEITAPILRLRAPAGVELRLEDDAAFHGNTLDLLALNPDGPAGILTPGSGGAIPIVYRSSIEGDISFTVDQLTPADSDAIAWSTIPPPQGFSAVEWNALRTPLANVLGASWSGYQEALGNIATRLLHRGMGGLNVLGTRELFRRAVLEARGTFPGSAIVGRAIRSPSNSPLAGAAVLAVESGLVQSSAITDSEGRFALECLQPGATYQLRMPAQDVGPAQASLPAGDVDLLGLELRGIEQTSALVPSVSPCDAYALPGKALEPPQSIFTPLETLGVRVVRSQDPNEKDGPEGEGPKRHISIGQEMIYTIHFENEGTAPAQVVTVTDPQDPTDTLDPGLDWSSFRMLEAGVGDQVFSLDLLSNGTSQVRQGYSGRRTQAQVRTGTPYSGVDVRCDFDPLTGRLSWIFETVNPTTGERAPDLPDEGFLPPNTTAPRGEGWVSFSIYPREDDADETVIRNDATIVLDDPPEVSTLSVFNLVWRGAFTLRAPRNPYPANGTSREVDALGLYLRWEGDPRSTSYDLWLWKQGESKPAQATATGLTRNFHVPERLIEDGEVYLWQVLALGSGGQRATGPEWRFATSAPALVPGEFQRGDANADGQRDISDATFVLAYLFTGGVAPGCLDSADSNDDGAVDISDPSTLLAYLFLGTRPALPLPFEACGPDPTGDGLTCESHAPCN